MPLTGEAKKAYQRDLMRKRREGLSRELESSGTESPAAVESEERANGSFLNQTDQAFEDKKPGYYIFEKEVLTKPCWYCNKTFQTKLQLNKFCCPEHKENWLKASLRRGA